MDQYEIEWRSPLDAFAPLSQVPWSVLLHSAGGPPGWSLIAAEPTRVIETRRGETRIDGAAVAGGPLEILSAVCRERSGATESPVGLTAAPFLSGLVGYAGYEIGALMEPSAAGPPSPFQFPDMAFGAYDAVGLFDHDAARAYIVAKTSAAAGRLAERLGAAGARRRRRPEFEGRRSNFSRASYEAMVSRVIELISDGALFQANVSQQLSALTAAPSVPYDVYCMLAESGAPFGAFLCYEEGAILSASPERFFRVGPGGRIVAEPIKGTRPRHPDPALDAERAAELLSDPKERAENIMIADLTRNDLSIICADGSIREEAICALESAAAVHHLVSRISGVLKDGVGAVDALAALFPCGSITGAPKIEAMRTIARLEKTGRGPYCGAIGYLDDRGRADFAVAIRTLIMEPRGDGWRAVYPVGGGVTLRSDPFTEYEETLAKACSAERALGLVEEVVS